MLGRASGRHLHALAHNYDPRPVRGAGAGAGRSARSGRSAAGGGRPRSWPSALIALVDRVTRRLRAAERVCRTVVLRMRFEDFSRATRSYTMREATDQTPTILHTANGLLKASMPMIERQGLTLIGIALTNLYDRGAVQLVLPFNRAPRPRRRRRPRAGPVRLQGDHARRAGRPGPGRVGAAAARLAGSLRRELFDAREAGESASAADVGVAPLGVRVGPAPPHSRLDLERRPVVVLDAVDLDLDRDDAVGAGGSSSSTRARPYAVTAMPSHTIVSDTRGSARRRASDPRVAARAISARRGPAGRRRTPGSRAACRRRWRGS